MLVTDADRAPDLEGAAGCGGSVRGHRGTGAVARYEDTAALERSLDPGDRVFRVSMELLD